MMQNLTEKNAVMMPVDAVPICRSVGETVVPDIPAYNSYDIRSLAELHKVVVACDEKMEPV
jgi:hypothetical protein